MQMLGKSDAVLIGFDAPEATDPAELARHAMDFWLTTEDLPLPGNRVSLDQDGRIRLRYTPTNLEAHRRLIEKFEGLLSAIAAEVGTRPSGGHIGPISRCFPGMRYIDEIEAICIAIGLTKQY